MLATCTGCGIRRTANTGFRARRLDAHPLHSRLEARMESVAWIADVARLLRKSTALDWTALTARARTSGTESILFLHAPRAQAFWSRAARRGRGLCSSCVENRHSCRRIDRLHAGSPLSPLIPDGTATCSSRERRIDRIRHVSRFLLTPGVGDWDTVRLPKFVTPLYRLVRLARVGQVAAQYAFRRA